MAVAFALLCVEAPPKWAVTIILGVAFLIPDALKVPYAPHYLTVYRLVVWASALGLILRVSRREIPTSALRPGRVHLLLLALVGFAYFVGVAGQVAPATFSPSYNIWLNFVDQILLVISLVAFGRVVGARWVLTRAVWVAAVAAGVGGWE
jgi:hypothetical protein